MEANGTVMAIVLARGIDVLHSIAASTDLLDTIRVPEWYEYELVYRHRYDSRHIFLLFIGNEPGGRERLVNTY